MNYVLANKEKALGAGFSPVLHRTTHDGLIVLTEREVTTSPLLDGDLQHRLESIGGKVVTKSEILK